MSIAVTKTVHIPPEWLKEISSPHPEGYFGVFVVECNTAYCFNTGPELMQVYGGMIASDTWNKYFQRFSKDNGRTWSEPIVMYQPTPTAGGSIRWNEGCLFLDEEKNRLCHFVNYALFPKKVLTDDVLKTTRMLEQISVDGGKTFKKRQLIQRGHDETNWAEGVVYGQNRIYVSFSAPLKLKNGNILLPVTRSPNPAGYTGYASVYHMPEDAGCMIGQWNGGHIDWDLSAMLTLAPSVAAHGLCEPALAEMADGSILMIMRGSNYKLAGVSGHKWQSLSRDGGWTWSPPIPWTYHTGEPFFSPASGSRLIRNSGNGKLYWIGNITPVNPTGGVPRCPIQIAEVDEQKKLLIKDTVAVIDTLQPGDGPETQLSNFRVYEDRFTHEFVLYLARIGERGGKDRTSPSYQYWIRINGTT